MHDREGGALNLEALRDVAARMETCLADLDRLGADLAAARLAHAIETLQLDMDDIAAD